MQEFATLVATWMYAILNLGTVTALLAAKIPGLVTVRTCATVGTTKRARKILYTLKKLGECTPSTVSSTQLDG